MPFGVLICASCSLYPPFIPGVAKYSFCKSTMFVPRDVVAKMHAAYRGKPNKHWLVGRSRALSTNFTITATKENIACAEEKSDSSHKVISSMRYCSHIANQYHTSLKGFNLRSVVHINQLLSKENEKKDVFLIISNSQNNRCLAACSQAINLLFPGWLAWVV